MNQKDREQMAHLRFTDAEKQGIVQRLIAAQDSASTPPRRRAALLRRMVTVGIAAALVLAAGVGAVTVYDRLASDSFSALFGTAHTEIIDSIGRPIGVSASDAGYTITAEAILGDQYNTCIIYTISRDDGQPLGFDTTYLRFEEQSTNIKGGNGAHGGAWFVDEDPTDNQIQYVESMSYMGEVELGRAKATFRKLVSCTADYEEAFVVDGEWILRFDVNYEDTSVCLLNGRELAMDSANGMITDVMISPIAFRIEYTLYGTVDVPSDAVEALMVELRLKDGRVINLKDAGGGTAAGDGVTLCNKGGVMAEIIPLEDMDCLIVDGQTLPI